MKFVHTNIVAQDFKKLAEFYKVVFECKPIDPPRDLKGKWIEEGTGVDGAEIKGVHMLLPGCGEEGPTLEIFEYNKSTKGGDKRVNRLGFAHISFRVDNIHNLLRKVIVNGGQQLGKLTSREIEGAGTITFVYVSDPEGNVIELQNWF